MSGRPPTPDTALAAPLRTLARRDADIRAAYRWCGLPATRRHDPGFAGLLRIIMAQQLSAASAQAIIGRLESAATPLVPESFLALDEEALRRIGLSRQKVRYGRALAEDVMVGRIDFAAVAALDDEAAIERLSQVSGVGRWSAEVYLLFALRRPDIWPADDLAVRAALQRLKRLPERPLRAEMMALGEGWRPYRSAAARLLWHFYNHPGVPPADE